MTTEHPIVERERLLAGGAVSWARLDTLLRENDARSSLHAQGATDWNSRDVYAHLARWMGFTIEQVRRKSAGIDWLPSIPGSDDEINERWAVADRTLSTDQARNWCIESAGTLRRLVGDLSLDQWTRFGKKCMDDISGEHYAAHIAFIEQGGS